MYQQKCGKRGVRYINKNIDCRYINNTDTDIGKDNLENINIDKTILQNVNIDIIKDIFCKKKILEFFMPFF